MSACMPAPPDGSDAANVRTMGGKPGSESVGIMRGRCKGGERTLDYRN
jgi:hypothetical protein